MVSKKRLTCRDDSDDSSSDCLEIRPSGLPLPSSLLTRKHDDDISGTETMLRKRKQAKTIASSSSKMIWSKNEELVILGSIVDYEKETKMSYRSDWDGFYGYVKDFIEANFSKQQLMDKIKNLKKRFLNNQARSIKGKGLSFTNTDDDEIFKTSMIIWATNETERASNENIDQAKDVPCVEHESADENDENMDQATAKVDVPSEENELVNENMDPAQDVPFAEHAQANENMEQENEDVPYAEHEQVDENMDQENEDVPYAEHERVDENVDQENVDVPNAEHEQANENMDQENDVPDVEHEPVSDITLENGKGEDEEGEEAGVDEMATLQDALEAMTWYQSFGQYQQNRLRQNLKNIGAQRRKELADEWKALLGEEMRLYARKLTLAARLASA
ncbi:hypothetical protein EUTSA_v10016755mg [Eutrema salsugineum]|uniref:Glabrous enhancer-binding protein-like DBD domain-containing protein n=1 Tax=Eutrema salsugineum TaxID=72664 RepID=V4NZ65_EUTSA|nr:hypothetical protein EUTSA_v10016755mg [Eutrema salsugineum]